ncbi:BPSL0761 family protein [Pseudomonas aeruginosa]|uniref:BPSL0761 family protein n=1 Tax=Pseudomonas aeruginosa TaxID=287 RepID=UPI0020C88FE1|nr:BPSL0761 family protein [Pseudomonas aeruginosa]
MTLPYERTRSVVQAQEFLVELSRDTTLSESIRNEARRLLCHYPSKGDMLQAGRNEEQAAGGCAEFCVTGVRVTAAAGGLRS